MTKENFVKFTFALIDYIDHLNKLSDLFDTDAFFGGPSGRFVDTIMECIADEIFPEAFECHTYEDDDGVTYEYCFYDRFCDFIWGAEKRPTKEEVEKFYTEELSAEIEKNVNEVLEEIF